MTTCQGRDHASTSIFVVAIFFEGFEFLVCSKFNHMQRDCTCACAVACLHPRNSMSNVVVSLMIHYDTYIYMFLHFRDVAENMKSLWKVEGFFNRTSWKVSDVQIVRSTWVFVSVSLCLCLCVLRVVCCRCGQGCYGGGGGRERGEGERLIEPSGC